MAIKVSNTTVIDDSRQLANISGIDATTKTTLLNAGVGGTTFVKKTAAYTAVNKDGIIADTTAGAFTITLPATPTVGYSVTIVDGGNWSVNNLTVARNGATIEGATSDLVLNSAGASLDFVYDGTTWQVYSSNSSSGVEVTDVSTNGTFYPTFAADTSGPVSSVSVASGKLTYNPSTGVLSTTLFNSTSDANKKTDVVTAAADVVDQLRGVEFSWIDSGEKSSGVIAQEVQAVVPHLVNSDENGLSVNYNGLLAYLIEAVKELRAEVKALKGE